MAPPLQDRYRAAMKLRPPWTLVNRRGPYAEIVECTGDEERARGRLVLPAELRAQHRRLVLASEFLAWLEANPGTDLSHREAEARYQRELDLRGITDDDVDLVHSDPWFVRGAEGTEIEIDLQFCADDVVQWSWSP
jgi:hypothetical protein